jgi:hypothetical protein
MYLPLLLFVFCMLLLLLLLLTGMSNMLAPMRGTPAADLRPVAAAAAGGANWLCPDCS